MKRYTLPGPDGPISRWSNPARNWQNIDNRGKVLVFAFSDAVFGSYYYANIHLTSTGSSKTFVVNVDRRDYSRTWIYCSWDVVPPPSTEFYQCNSNMWADVLRLSFEDEKSFSIYFNGELISSESCADLTFDKAALVMHKENVWVPLVILNDTEREQGEGFAKAMEGEPKAVEEIYFELEKTAAYRKRGLDDIHTRLVQRETELDDAAKELLEREERVQRGLGGRLETALEQVEAREKAAYRKRGLDDIHKRLAQRETELDEKAKELLEREEKVQRGLGGRLETALKQVEAREKAAAGREQELNAKERGLEDRATELYGDGRDVAASDGAQDHYKADVQPPDADLMRLSATAAWPLAVNEVLGRSSLATIQKRHNMLMDEWAVARGDNISSDHYDYAVYSQGVVWPKAILESTDFADLTKIREKHQQILDDCV